MDDNDELTGKLAKLSKKELIDKIIGLQKKCDHMKNAVKPSKLQEMNQRFQPRKVKKNKPAKEIDFLKCNYRYVAFKVAYLGWDYDGLQSNEGLDDTIEGILKEALRKTRLVSSDLSVRFTKCGRTDKTVSAFTQVMSVLIRTKLTDDPCIVKWKDCTMDWQNRNDAVEGDEISLKKPEMDFVSIMLSDQQHDFESSTHCKASQCEKKLLVSEKTDILNDKSSELNDTPELPAACDDKKKTYIEDKEFDYILILNQVLPPEIRILAWTPVDESFTARWKCQRRVYHYYFPLGNLNLERMNAAAQRLCGLHDFRNFAKLNVQNCKVFVRNMYEFTVKYVDGNSSESPYSMCYAVICASGFLYHQVRNMMTILFLIGSGKEEPSLISELLDIKKHPRRPAYYMSPGYSLVLFDATYNDLKWHVDRCTAARLLVHFKSYWTELAVKTCMVKELIDLIANDKETALTGVVNGFAGVKDDCSSSFTELNASIAKQSSCGDVNFNFLKDACTLTHRNYKKVLDRQKCKSFEEELDALERKRQHSLGSSSDSSTVQSKRACL